MGNCKRKSLMFNTINYFLFEEKKNELNYELVDEFSPFYTTKTLSFFKGGQYAQYINDTLNLYGNIFDNKEEQFKFYENVIPKHKRKQRLDYIKKNKSESESEEIPQEFYSKKELKMLNEMLK